MKGLLLIALASVLLFAVSPVFAQEYTDNVPTIQSITVQEEGSMNIQGTSDRIDYKINGGTLYSIIPDNDFISWILKIDMPIDGSLTLVIPRAFFDSIFNEADNDFIVLIDGDEPTFTETQTNSQSRTLSIELPAGSEEVEIIGSSFDNADDSTTTPESEPICIAGTYYDSDKNSCVLIEHDIPDPKDTTITELKNEVISLKLENRELKQEVTSLNQEIDQLKDLLINGLKEIYAWMG